MIKITIKKEKENIKAIEIKGHANYDEYGKDIVCASVSSIVITSVNAIIRIDEKSISFKQDEGFTLVEVKKNTDVVNSLLDNMIDMLKELEQQYNKYIKII